MSEGTTEDKLACVRAAGKAVRDALASNMQARIGDVVEVEVLDETRDVLVSVLRMYLAQIIPNVQVEGLVKLPKQEKSGRIGFELNVRGSITVSIEPGAEDDTLPGVGVPVSSRA